MKLKIFFFTAIFVVFSPVWVKAHTGVFSFNPSQNNKHALKIISTLHPPDSIQYGTFKTKINSIGLCILLGPLGMHRIYLGSPVYVPVFYTITLGCGGLLPLMDLIAIIGHKNIEDYHNNSKIIMWLNPHH